MNSGQVSDTALLYNDLSKTYYYLGDYLNAERSASYALYHSKNAKDSIASYYNLGCAFRAKFEAPYCRIQSINNAFLQLSQSTNSQDSVRAYCEIGRAVNDRTQKVNGVLFKIVDWFCVPVAVCVICYCGYKFIHNCTKKTGKQDQHACHKNSVVSQNMRDYNTNTR